MSQEFYYAHTNTDTTWSANTLSYADVLAFTIRIAAPPPDPPFPQAFVDAVFEAACWLGLELPLSKKEQINEARRTMARVHHPDAGGDAETMKTINAAADFLLGLLKR